MSLMRFEEAKQALADLGTYASQRLDATRVNTWRAAAAAADSGADGLAATGISKSMNGEEGARYVATLLRSIADGLEADIIGGSDHADTPTA